MQLITNLAGKGVGMGRVVAQEGVAREVVVVEMGKRCCLVHSHRACWVEPQREGPRSQRKSTWAHHLHTASRRKEEKGGAQLATSVGVSE
jgi:hypothetical protein